MKQSLIEEFKLDITDEKEFPGVGRKWKAFCEKLVKEGRAEMEPHPEVDPVTMEAINKLLLTTKKALELRGTEFYEEALSKIPLALQGKLNYVLQWGAQMQLMLYEVR